MPKPPNSIRLVPYNPDDEEFGDLADRQGWEMTDRSAHDIHQWRVPATGTLVSWVVDPDTSVEFIVVEGADREQIAKHIQQSIKMLRKPDFEAYIEQVPNTQGRSHGLWAVAAAAPDESDADVVKLIEHYLNDNNPIIRRAALLAVGVTGWQEFVETVEAMRDDPDKQTRGDAERTLQALHEANN